MTGRRFAILGTVGVPGNYGGFETLAENLVRYHDATGNPNALTVYCSAHAYPERPDRFLSAELRYVPLNANGAQSIPYDIWSLLSATRQRTDVILLLGVSGALALPLVRLISRTRIVTNIDGIEWKRQKWTGLARRFLRLSERMAVRWSHVVIADNEAIADHVAETYGAGCEVVAYAGDHALSARPDKSRAPDLPDRYALALCRIEPENNVAMILDAFSRMPDEALVFVGNWDKSPYGRDLRQRYATLPNLYLCDPVYDPGGLRYIRDQTWLYVHGHSAGGTNPSLVEMMHFSIPILAHGCGFNRHTTENRARYFEDAETLASEVLALSKAPGDATENAKEMIEIAHRRYTWAQIGKEYFELLERGGRSNPV